MSTQGHTAKENIDAKPFSMLRGYPVDTFVSLIEWGLNIDSAGVPLQVNPVSYHPTIIAHYALTQWNYYLSTKDEQYRDKFLIQAHWLVKHEIRISNDAGGWPISFPLPDVHSNKPWLSSVTQGCALSVLVRAYHLTQDEVFLEVVHRISRTFVRDILDGGVSSPIGEDGIFFEEFAVYPAKHTLSGSIFALIGLYDYIALTNDAEIKELIQTGLSTLHVLLDEFDIGFWIRSDTLHRRLVSPVHLALQIKLLEALVAYSHCDHCSTLIMRWRRYLLHPGYRLRYLVTNHCVNLSNALLNWVRSFVFPKAQVSPILRVCVPITMFPVSGGMRTILMKIEEIMSDVWHMEYLAQYVGPDAEKFTVHRFGLTKTSPWQFPMVWFYCLTGLQKLTSLLRHGASYDIILPQDGVFTAAFAAFVGKLAGIRVVCIDHGNLVSLISPLSRTERLRVFATKHWTRRIIERFLIIFYWPSLSFFAWFAARFIDHFCIPGVVGDGVEEVCKRLGVGPSRLTRFVNTIDMGQYIVLDDVLKAKMREQRGIPANAIVIATICRLSPEKGIDIALEAMSYALSMLPRDLSTRIQFIIAGDGILRRKIEEDIKQCGLGATCMLWGEISHADARLLHSLSDIYLYTGTRGGGYSLVILEAMAAGCAVLASSVPLANEHMLADGRGIIVPAGDAKQTGTALTQLVSDTETRRQMGYLARNYVALHNTTSIFRRTWLRTTYWSELDRLLNAATEEEK